MMMEAIVASFAAISHSERNRLSYFKQENVLKRRLLL
jgi:hypothetical protein